ncbi:MAG TPA: hypothetical protein VN915_02535 [Elusimicrobiota bacterium]|nr:hypothetical protein [Elusimicrobiota bacterium]
MKKANPALVVIDVQKEYTTPGRSPYTDELIFLIKREAPKLIRAFEKFRSDRK